MAASAPIDLPYRPCVGIMVLNRDGKIFAGRRSDIPGAAWQMPQGGIDAGEDPRAAALRELVEETGISSVRVLAETSTWLTYDYPDAVRRRSFGGRFRGQRQKWFAMRFVGDDAEIDLHGHSPEFDRWDWMLPGDLLDQIIAFKRPIYDAVVREFDPWIGGNPT